MGARTGRCHVATICAAPLPGDPIGWRSSRGPCPCYPGSGLHRACGQRVSEARGDAQVAERWRYRLRTMEPAAAEGQGVAQSWEKQGQILEYPRLPPE